MEDPLNNNAWNESLKHLKKRADIIRCIRRYFYQNGYLEVDTPVRIPAPAPEAHISIFETEGWYLQSSPELCMKQLVAQGYDKIFQICKCFRKEETGDLHLTELTLLEWYTKGHTYLDLMDQCCDMIQFTAAASDLSHCLEYGSHRVDLGSPWERISVKEAFNAYSSMSMDQALKLDKFDEIMAFDIEPRLGTQKPCFLYDYPASRAALARLKKNRPHLCERFELYIAGIELANGFSELTHAQEQRHRFEREMDIRKKAGKKNTPMPEKFLKSLEKMPETAGIALGIDRLVMVFTNSLSIDRVTTFTHKDL